MTSYSRDSNTTVLPPELASQQIMRERNARRMKKFLRFQKRMQFLQKTRRPLTRFERVKLWFRRWFSKR